MSPIRVGITYDLECDQPARSVGDDAFAELDAADTIDAIERALHELGMGVERIGNASRLSSRLMAGHRWDLIFNIAEGLHGFGRESLVPALLDAYRIPYTFSDPLTTALSLHKGFAKLAVRNHGVPTADYALVEHAADAWRVELPMPLFAKPVAEGASKGVSRSSKIIDRRRLISTCEELLARYQQPVLVETYLPGREFTVGILGTGPEAYAVGALELRFAPNRTGFYDYESKRSSDLAPRCAVSTDAYAREAERVALAAYRVLGCRDAGRIDVRFDALGNGCFLEANALPGLRPGRADLPVLFELLRIPYTTLIGMIVDGALRRCGAREDTQPMSSRDARPRSQRLAV